jgi:hypothetical protein
MDNRYIKKTALREWVIDNLSSYGRVRRDEIWICCPFHIEKTPSMTIHIGDALWPGTYHCFGCGTKGSYNRLAAKMNLPIFPHDDVEVKENDNIFDFLAKGIKSDFERDWMPKTAPQVVGLEEIPKGFEWREIPGSFYKSLNGSIYYDSKKNVEFLHFPLYDAAGYNGYTLARLKRDEDNIKEPKYLTFAETDKTLFLYDTFAPSSTVILVEGHYDAIRLRYYGLPALAILGTQNWSEYKRNLLVTKGIQKAIILFDNDNAGMTAAKKISEELSSAFEVQPLILPNTGTKIDPGNMPISYIQALKTYI